MIINNKDLGKYCIVYMPGNGEDEPIWGFKTKEDAYKYLETKIACKLDKNKFGCKSCIAEYDIWEVNYFFPDWLLKILK